MQPVALVLSERKIAANRSNALKSTGPRTPAGKARSRLNALKHGRFAQRARAMMLGEDPRENKALLDELLEACRPANAAERMLVEDIAALRLQRRRSDRAQAAKQACAVERLEFERRRRLLELRRASPPVPFVLLESAGVCSAPDCAGKFQMMRDYLQAALRSVENRHFSRTVADILRAVYGRMPQRDALEIISGYERLVESPPADSTADDEVEILRMRLQQELRTIDEEFDLYVQEQMEVSPARQDASLAPDDADWKLLIRQANTI
ncbi:MAG TPA: hypothetical protein VFM21_10780, partial [Terriglobia bacterium]|nr:hypothetical protein [Terriglobia bacterium]